MDAQTFEQLVSDSETRRRAIRQKKRSDYDKDDDDRLSSFRKVAAIVNALEVDGFSGFTPSGIATIMLALKLVRDANLKNSGRPPQNESRMDTTDDLINYVYLKTGCEVDEQASKDAVK
jgi:hypothetical protein